MSNTINFSCSYIVCRTGYIDNFIKGTNQNTDQNNIRVIDEENNKKYCKELAAFCIEKKVIPFFVANKTVQLLSLQGGDVVLNMKPTAEEMTKATTLIGKLGTNLLDSDGIIVFKTKTFNDAANVANSLRRLSYCHIDQMTMTTFISNEERIVDILYVEYKAKPI